MTKNGPKAIPSFARRGRVTTTSLLGVALVSVLVLLCGVTADASALQDGAPVTIDAEQECVESNWYLPADYRLPPATEPADEGTVVDVLMLVDGFPHKFAKDVVVRVNDLYSTLGLAIRVTGYRKVAMKAALTGPTGTPAGEPFDLLAQMKAAVGGERPKGADAVYMLTAKEMFFDLNGNGQIEDSESILGMADCIRGVEYPDRSFAVGVGYHDHYVTDVQAAARIMAHELGHLLGAAHGHASCVEGATGGPSRDGSIRPCTIMHGPQIKYGAFDSQADHWSAMEKATIQGHADEYARP